jgi:hypothetical protein
MKIKEGVLQMAGRYTLRQALTTLCDNVEIENPELAMRFLVANIQTGSIPVYEPGNSIPIKKPKSVDENHEEVEWIDLNRFVNGLKVLSSWRFPDPTELNQSLQKNSAGNEFNGCGWRVRPTERSGVLRAILLDQVESAYLANKPIPRIVNLVNQWKLQMPPEIKGIGEDYIKVLKNYQGSETELVSMKAAGLKINRLVEKTPKKLNKTR